LSNLPQPFRKAISLRASLRSSLRTSLRTSLRSSLRASLRTSLRSSLRSSLTEARFPAIFSRFVLRKLILNYNNNRDNMLNNEDLTNKISNLHQDKTFDEIYPWDRLPGETVNAFAAFLAYRDMINSKSVSKVAETIGKSQSYVTKLSSINKWKKRAEAYQTYMDKKEQEMKLKQIEEMVKRHSTHAAEIETAMMIPINKFLEKAKNKMGDEKEDDLSKKTIGELLNIVYTTADLFPKIVDAERKSRGVPTDINSSNIDLTSKGNAIKPPVTIIVNGSKSNILQNINKEIASE